MALTLERDFSGRSAWTVRNPETGESKRVEGRAASLLSMLIAQQGYELREDFHPFDAFTEESLARGCISGSPRYDKPEPRQ